MPYKNFHLPMHDSNYCHSFISTCTLILMSCNTNIQTPYRYFMHPVSFHFCPLQYHLIQDVSFIHRGHSDFILYKTFNLFPSLHYDFILTRTFYLFSSVHYDFIIYKSCYLFPFVHYDFILIRTFYFFTSVHYEPQLNIRPSPPQILSIT